MPCLINKSNILYFLKENKSKTWINDWIQKIDKGQKNKEGWSATLEGNHVWDGFGIDQFESSLRCTLHSYTWDLFEGHVFWFQILAPIYVRAIGFFESIWHETMRISSDFFWETLAWNYLERIYLFLWETLAWNYVDPIWEPLDIWEPRKNLTWTCRDGKLWMNYLRVIWDFFGSDLRGIWKIWEFFWYSYLRVIWQFFPMTLKVIWEVFSMTLRVIGDLFEHGMAGYGKFGWDSEKNRQINQQFFFDVFMNLPNSFEVCFEISRQTSNYLWTLLWSFKVNFKGWLWSFNANFKGKFEVLVETSKRFWTLIETSKGGWSFHWNYKEAFEVCFEISKSPFEVYFEISKQTSKVVWSLPWNFKANFKGICFICLFSIFFKNLVDFFNSASIFFGS